MSSNGIVRTLAGSNAATVGESSNSDLTNELAGQDLSGVCECGSCTISSFLQNISCSHPSQVPALSLPFLDLTHMDNNERQRLLGRLYLEYKAVVGRFSKLKKAVHRLISERKTTFGNLSKIVTKLDSFMPSIPQDEKMAEIRKAKSIVKLFALLPEDGSFLDFQIFEDLAGELKNESLKTEVKAYKRLLDVYCRRGIFECPSFSPTGKNSYSNFIIELHGSHCKMRIQELVLIQEQLCGVLSVVSNTLCPCNVSKMQSGNIQVIFRVPNYVKDVLLPLNAEQETSLRQLGFIGWSFYNGLDISYDPAQLANQLLATDRMTGLVSNHAAAGGHSSSLLEGQRLDDLSSEDEDDEDASPRKKLKPAPGKKTRGRVKIPMEYIKNKLRRYTTFSKRKSNIMKKAYELSTLTGTQVMLMVASETGHVYTFATPKLQPMITSDAGKALIQTCLHQPDNTVPAATDGNAHSRVRMSSSGYEETDLGGYLPGNEDAQSKVLPLPPSSNHSMPSIYNPPHPSIPLSLTNELLPSGMLQSLVTSSAHSLLPPPLISPDGYSGEEGGEHAHQDENAMPHSPGS